MKLKEGHILTHLFRRYLSVSHGFSLPFGLVTTSMPNLPGINVFCLVDVARTS